MRPKLFMVPSTINWVVKVARQTNHPQPPSGWGTISTFSVFFLQHSILFAAVQSAQHPTSFVATTGNCSKAELGSSVVERSAIGPKLASLQSLQGSTEWQMHRMWRRSDLIGCLLKAKLKCDDWTILAIQFGPSYDFFVFSSSHYLTAFHLNWKRCQLPSCTGVLLMWYSN